MYNAGLGLRSTVLKRALLCPGERLSLVYDRVTEHGYPRRLVAEYLQCRGVAARFLGVRLPELRAALEAPHWEVPSERHGGSCEPYLASRGLRAGSAS